MMGNCEFAFGKRWNSTFFPKFNQLVPMLKGYLEIYFPFISDLFRKQVALGQREAMLRFQN